MLEKYAGLLILGLFLFWIFKDAGASVGILHNLGGASNSTFNALRGA